MECKASGSLPMSFSWYKERILITTNEKYKILSQDNTTTLEVNQLEISDHGTYICKATNSVGSDECSAFLNITGLKDEFASSLIYIFFVFIHLIFLIFASYSKESYYI